MKISAWADEPRKRYGLQKLEKISGEEA